MRRAHVRVAADGARVPVALDVTADLSDFGLPVDAAPPADAFDATAIAGTAVRLLFGGDAQRRPHAARGVAGQRAQQPVAAGAAQRDLERPAPAEGGDLGARPAPVPARADDREVVGVLAEVRHPEPHAARAHRRAVGRHRPLAQADADTIAGGGASAITRHRDAADAGGVG